MPTPPPYLERFRQTLAKHKGRPLIGAEQIDRRKGEWNISRLVVVEFADKANAVAACDEYEKEVLPLRPGGTHDILIVEGVE